MVFRALQAARLFGLLLLLSVHRYNSVAGDFDLSSSNTRVESDAETYSQGEINENEAIIQEDMVNLNVHRHKPSVINKFDGKVQINTADGTQKEAIKSNLNEENTAQTAKYWRGTDVTLNAKSKRAADETGILSGTEVLKKSESRLNHVAMQDNVPPVDEIKAEQQPSKLSVVKLRSSEEELNSPSQDIITEDTGHSVEDMAHEMIEIIGDDGSSNSTDDDDEYSAVQVRELAIIGGGICLIAAFFLLLICCGKTIDPPGDTEADIAVPPEIPRTGSSAGRTSPAGFENNSTTDTKSTMNEEAEPLMNPTTDRSDSYPVIADSLVGAAIDSESLHSCGNDQYPKTTAENNSSDAAISVPPFSATSDDKNCASENIVVNNLVEISSGTTPAPSSAAGDKIKDDIGLADSMTSSVHCLAKVKTPDETSATSGVDFTEAEIFSLLKVDTSSAKIAATPTATSEATPTATSEATPKTTNEATPTATSEATPTATSEATPAATSEATPAATSEATPVAT
ncbi:uncharacterized protein LOC108681727 [Hyalella azteca]|uniref:Uncharacterized protein LOC108681727 n=1 Tax=Hyalella azteca TaxID=294128 RepID=A0A8B7PJD0_HYAAZ|nr:uncharacterized protein LOC108681727 [Hyalella azteca]